MVGAKSHRVSGQIQGLLDRAQPATSQTRSSWSDSFGKSTPRPRSRRWSCDMVRSVLRTCRQSTR